MGHRPVGAADARALPDRRAADDRPRPRLPGPSGADPGRVHRALRGAGPPPCARDRPHHRHLGLHGRRSRGPARRSQEPDHRLPAGAAGLAGPDGAAIRRRSAISCSSVRSSRGRTSPACSRRTAGWWRATRRRRRWCWSGGRSPNRRRCWRSSTSIPSPGGSSTAATSPTRSGPALYAGATALILPSFLEGFGLPVLEAMTVGVPVIASDRGALPEVLGDAGLLVSPDDPEELAAAMQRVVTDARLAATLGARGARRSLIFDWTASATTLREIYEALTTASRGRRRPGARHEDRRRRARAGPAPDRGRPLPARDPAGVGRTTRPRRTASSWCCTRRPRSICIARVCTAPARASRARRAARLPRHSCGSSCGCRSRSAARRRRPLRAGLLGAALRAGARPC